jgi:methionyl-tRNA formyltransferase
MKKPTFVFFGTPTIATIALDQLMRQEYVPSLIVTNPDAPAGRRQVLTQPPVKQWAEDHAVPCIQPVSLKDPALIDMLACGNYDFFVVYAYGKLLPQSVLEIPRFCTINGHPSLLPKLRGASPIRSSLLSDLDAVGVTIIKMDEKLDHGPILTQEKILLTKPVLGRELDYTLSVRVGQLLGLTMDDVYTGTHSPLPQEDSEATYCGKITKEMGELNIDPHALPFGTEAHDAYRKICAFDGWPGTFFMYNGKRIKITAAHIDQDTLMVERVIPEGKNEMPFDQYLSTKK